MDNKRLCPNCRADYIDADSHKQSERLSAEKIPLKNLIRFGREVIIEHNNEDYCLRRTSRNRLILTKVKLSVVLSSDFFGFSEMLIVFAI